MSAAIENRHLLTGEQGGAAGREVGDVGGGRGHPQSLHVDAAAASGAFGGLIASGIHSLAIFQRLAVQGAFADWQVIAGRRLVDVEFRRPVRPEDALTGSMTIDDIVVDDRGRALVIAAAALVDQDERTVLTTVIEVLVRARP
ncbi:MaoC/PaaZ C-terminal domain-containing protein [Gordonia sp. ABSL11-1]|uniref:MaoC/PaaZ C-terminal domain-containing protein n=1 Tax=Gordonia sp. ABSL11-1 TaxID=3053924 RepID=UPI002573E18E|nr:MaoC/PaaZ C-terminal domain-containing protein [Gordonia sp. ABSL11-1]MDL9945478.1 MaoC/PaaZ C-terminal domain-containing protein [Gordonia sp. ABSL11-1]